MILRGSIFGRNQMASKNKMISFLAVAQDLFFASAYAG